MGAEEKRKTKEEKDSSTKGTKGREVKNPVIPRGLGRALKKDIGRELPMRSFQAHVEIKEKRREKDANGNDVLIIGGYASTKDVDLTGEIVEPSAFAECIEEFMTNPLVTYMHNWSDPIGKVLEAKIDEVGLHVRAQISATAQKVWKLIEEGVLRAFSIGYEVVEETLIAGVNHIKKLRLYEVAVVSIPANRRCLFSVSKALEKGTDLVCEDCKNCGKEETKEEAGFTAKTQRSQRKEEGKEMKEEDKPKEALTDEAINNIGAAVQAGAEEEQALEAIENLIGEVRESLKE